MDSSLSTSRIDSSSTDISSSQSFNNYIKDPKYGADALIIETTLAGNNSQDSVDFDLADLSKGITITAQEIIAKLNDLLKTKLPNGIESLKPEEVTAEATAARIVQGSTAFFEIYAKQNPELSGEELLDSFMEKIRGGIQQGYDDAYNTLEGLGAFSLDGIREGVEQTKLLIEEKLNSFYQAKRKELGLLSEDVQVSAAEIANTEVLKQAGARSVSIVA